MCFIGDKDRLLFCEVIKGGGVLLMEGHVRVKALRRGEADVDGILADALEVLHLHHWHLLAVDDDMLCKQVFGRGLVEEVVHRLLDDVVQVDEEEKIAIALLVEPHNQPRHNQRLSTASCHVEEHLQGIRAHLTGVVGDEIAEGVLLVGTQFKFRVQVLRDALRLFRI